MDLANILGINKVEEKIRDSLASRLGIDATFYNLPELRHAREEFQTYFIDHALARNDYNISETARQLDIDRKTIQRRSIVNDSQMRFSAGKEAIKNAMLRVLDHYLPETQKNYELLDAQAEELSKQFEDTKKSLAEATKLFEFYLVGIALNQSGDKKAAAENLGVSERTIDRKLENIRAEEFYKKINYN